MKKILSLFILIIILFFGNSVFANISTNVFLYKDNVIEIISRNEGILNGESFTGTIVIGDNGKILHTLTQSGKIVNLDGKTISDPNILFLENGNYIISSQLKYETNIISTNLVDGDNKMIGFRNYFINENGDLLNISFGYPYNFIDKEKKDLIYDITCNSGSLNFNNNGKNILNTNGVKKIYFPTNVPGDWDYPIDTFLNINGIQYKLTDDDVGIYGCNISISSDSKLESKEVKNTEIIKGVKNIDNKNINKKEIIKGGYKFNVGRITLYNINGDLYYNGKNYLLKNNKNKVEIAKNESNFLIIVRENNDKYTLYLNMKVIFNGNNTDLNSILSTKYSDYEELSNKDALPISLDEYKDLLKNTKETIIIGKNEVNDGESKNNSNQSNINNSQNEIVETTDKNTQIKEKSKYLKQKIFSASALKKAKQEKYISAIEQLVKKQNKEKLEIIYKNIGKVKTKYIGKNKNILDYLEAIIYLELNK